MSVIIKEVKKKVAPLCVSLEKDMKMVLFGASGGKMTGFQF